MIFSAVFWTLSRSLMFCWLKLLCQTVADCSSKLLTNKMYISFISLTDAPKLATLLKICILAFALLITFPVFRSQEKFSSIMVPNKLVLETVSIVS